MVFLFGRLWVRWVGRVSWRTPLLILGGVFLSSWAVMALVEPDTGIADPATYWWWFLVTSATVGYGDFFPSTLGGRLVGGYVILGGIVTLTTLFAQLSTTISRAKGRRMLGLTTHDLTGHIVLLGYTPGRTERLARDLIREGTPAVVVCAWDDQASSHPMPEDDAVHFVRGDLTDLEVLNRAAPERASAVLVDARDDNEAVTLTVAADECAPGVHTVVTLRDLARRRTIDRVDSSVHCVQWHTPRMAFEELQDPGIARLYEVITSPGGPSTWSTPVPEGGETTYGAWQHALGSTQGATLLAVRVGDQTLVSASWDTVVPQGAVLFYVGPRRIEAAELPALLPH